MPGNPTDDSEPLPASRIMPGPADLLHYPAHNLVAWQPQGVLDDQLLDTGASGFFIKPLDNEKFISAVQDALEQA
jgi:hypothetical protein